MSVIRFNAAYVSRLSEYIAETLNCFELSIHALPDTRRAFNAAYRCSSAPGYRADLIAEILDKANADAYGERYHEDQGGTFLFKKGAPVRWNFGTVDIESSIYHDYAGCDQLHRFIDALRCFSYNIDPGAVYDGIEELRLDLIERVYRTMDRARQPWARALD